MDSLPSREAVCSRDERYLSKVDLSLKYLRERLSRWFVYIMDFYFVLEHRAVKYLVVPDTLILDAVQKQLERDVICKYNL